MIGFPLRLSIGALALWLASEWAPGIGIKGAWMLLVAALFGSMVVSLIGGFASYFIGPLGRVAIFGKNGQTRAGGVIP